MSARTLFDSAFANIPDTVRFPWDVVEKRVEAASGSTAVIESGGFTVLSGDEPTQPTSTPIGDGDAEVEPEHVDFTGAFGGTDGGAINMEEVEQAAADKQAEKDYLRRLEEEKAAQAARTAAAATPANSRTAGRKTARSRGIKTVSSDPDSVVLEEAVDISGLLVAQWEKKREEVNTKEQLALLMGERAAAGEGATCVHSGSICLYDPTKGYGFLAPDVGGPDIYFGKDSITGWAPEAVAEAAFPTNALTRRVVEEFPPYLIPGERVQFDVVQPEDQHQGGGRGGKEKRVRATMVKGEEGTLLLARAIKEGKRLRGVIRQMNLDNFKGHIQFGGSADGSRTEPTPTELAGMSVVERAHAKGFVDACFTHPCVFHGGGGTVHASSESLQRGTLVEYTILRDIDVKTGKPIAVCIVPVGGTTTTLQVNPSSGGGGGGQRGGRRVDNTTSGGPQQQQMLLFDDGDTGTW